ncbi:hypothetical protein BC629DRAFT_184662 [Irpex lacteus]|nr:hypothetical protein BC629DRAFT_184662 [Irpex lacteus]
MAAAMEQLAATRQSRRAQMYEEYERSKAEEVVRFQATLRRQREAEVRRRKEAQNVFLDTFGLRHSEREEPRRVPVMPQPQPAPSPKTTTPHERLRRRLEVDEDAEVQEVIENLLNLFVPSAPAYPQEAKPAEAPVKQDKGKARESPVAFPWEVPTKSGAEPNNVNEAARTVRFNVPVTTTPAAPRQPTVPTSVPTTTQAEHTNLRRVHAIRRSVDIQLSLGAIDRISALLQELKSSFVFPTDLDHSRSSSPSPVTPDSDSPQLPFTSKNKPVHVYEHALNGLLAKLDEVDSHGDEEVRRRRKEVVLEVEKALAEVDRKVAEASPKLEKSNLPEEFEICPLPTAPVATEAVVISNEAETKPEVAKEALIASSEDSRPPLVTEESVPAATQSEATEEDTQTTDTTSSVVVDSEAVLDAVPVVIESVDVPTRSGIHTNSIANTDLSANAEASEDVSEGEDTVVPEHTSADAAVPKRDLEVLPPVVESAAPAAPATPCEAAPVVVRTPTLLSEITSSSKDAKAIEQDHSTATTSPLPVPASEPTLLSPNKRILSSPSPSRMSSHHQNQSRPSSYKPIPRKTISPTYVRRRGSLRTRRERLLAIGKALS